MGQLWATHWDGSQPRLLAKPAKGESLWFPRAAADGSCFVAWLSRSDGTQDVARVELNGRVTVLTSIGMAAQPAMKNLRLGNAPSLSPDGKRIAYGFNGNIWVMDANGYNAETLISDGASWSPAFSPDGKSLAYVNGVRGKYDLWVTDLSSRDTWQITDFAAYSVGSPCWSKDGSHILLTRSQADESNVVQVLASTDTPLADADMITHDQGSASAVFSPTYNRILFSSQRGVNGSWRLVSADPTGADPKVLSEETALSPAWLRPSSATAMVSDLAPSRPTPVPPKPTPAAVAAAPMAPAAPKTMPAAVPTAVPANATAIATAAPAKPVAVAAKPTAVSVQHVAATAPVVARPSTAPTQPPMKAAPLRMRYKASFADDDSLSPASLADLKKLAPRVKQYDSARIQVIGPLDNSALRGRHASPADRSQVRAQAVAKALAKLAGLDATKVLAEPYSPATAGSGAPNSIQVYVELK